MRTITSLVAAGLLACSMSAIAADERAGDTTTEGRGSDIAANKDGNVVRDGTANGEFNNECAWGLANGKHVETNCSVNLTREDGKTYCFSNDKAMTAFMKDPTKNTRKASDVYGRS